MVVLNYSEIVFRVLISKYLAMMDDSFWNALLTSGTLIAAVTAVFFWRENKRIKKSEAQRAEAEAKTAEAGTGKAQVEVVADSTNAIAKLFELLTSQQERFNSIIKDKDKVIEQQQGLIEGYKKALEEANQKLKTLEYKVSDNDRKIAGMQKTIDSEIKDRRIAENNICFVSDCDLRKPKLGTYKKNNDE